MIEFKVNNQVVKIDGDSLEKIRKVVADELLSSKDEVRHTLGIELAKAVAIIGDEECRLGPWVLTVREDRLALVRIPPRSAMNYIFVAKLSLDHNRWAVTDFYQERMKGL